MTRLRSFLLAAALGCSALACATPGPHIRVASATAADLAAARDADSVWYEFRPGDEVPFQFLVFGDAVSVGEPTKLVARKHFWIILNKQGPLQLSYDGSSASADEMEFVLSVVPDQNGRAKVVWLNHVGTGDPDQAFQELMGPEEPPPSAPSSAPPPSEAPDSDEDVETVAVE